MEMHFSKDQQKKLMDAFSAAHREKEPVHVSGNLPQQVMMRIRRMEASVRTESYVSLFAQLVWRMAPVAVCAILVLCFFMMNTDLTPEYEIAQYVGSDPISYDFCQLYGK